MLDQFVNPLKSHLTDRSATVFRLQRLSVESVEISNLKTELRVLAYAGDTHQPSPHARYPLDRSRSHDHSCGTTPNPNTMILGLTEELWVSH